MQPGTEIDGFTLGERLHVGTMASIYRLMGDAAPLPLIMKIPRLGAGERAANVISFEVCRQVLGVRCDPRSDVFAFGALLYELATGARPFGLPKTAAQLRRRLYREPVPPRAIVAQTPEWLQEVILHCLEVDGRDRYASAAQVAFDLANPAHGPITERGRRARPPGWGGTPRRASPSP